MGFVGSNVLVRMVQKYPDCFFVSLDNQSYGSNPANLDEVRSAPNLECVVGDICSEGVVRLLMEKHQFDTVMHFAAQTSVDRSFARPTMFAESNVMGTSVLLKAAKEFGVGRFLHMSTDEVYGESIDGAAFTEDSPLRPMNP